VYEGFRLDSLCHNALQQPYAARTVCVFLVQCDKHTFPLRSLVKVLTMSSQHCAPFVGQRYLNLESYKRDGAPVQTPVWFAEEQGVLYVYTLANAGKVKRIRRHPRIRLALCTMRGTVIGPWVEAEATIVDATTAALWTCFTPAQIWLNEGHRRPGQSPPAPGTSGDSHSVSRVTSCPDRCARQSWKRSAF